MKRLSYLVTIIALGSVWLYGCGDKDKDTTKPIVAGKGGTTNLILHPQHHYISRNLINCTIYIKYNTLDVPTGGYDDSVKCTNEDTVVVGTFNGLQNGNYFTYCNGYDTSINKGVHGGISFTISEQGKTLTGAIPISEE